MATRIRFVGKIKSIKESFTRKISSNEKQTISGESKIEKPQNITSKSKTIVEYKETLYANPLIEKTGDRNFEYIETSIDTLDQDKSKSEVERAVDRILSRKHKK